MKLIDLRRSSDQLLRLRYQLLCVLLAVLMPVSLLWWFGPTSPFDIALLARTSVYGLLAGFTGVLLLRSIRHYPGVEASAYTLSSIGISYGTLLMILILMRLPYNRTLLFSNFLLIVCWFIFANVLAGRRRSLTIGVVPGGDHQSLLRIGGVRWLVFDNPTSIPEGLNAVSADLRIDLPSIWDRRLADFALEGLPVYHTKHLAESLTGRVELEHLSENNFGTLSPISSFMHIKHVADWITAAALAVALAPMLAVVAIVIRLDSAGSPIFRQTRIGYRGKPFTVYKFRTMVNVAPPASSSLLDAAKTRTADPRITRIGSFLRRSRIDELPQILNVLRGEMSWIGPRPEARVLSDWYEGEIPFYRYRHIVRPGLTGWAQVNQGHVADVEDVKQKLCYDFYYIKNYSPWIDLLIVGKTAKTMLTGFGAR